MSYFKLIAFPSLTSGIAALTTSSVIKFNVPSSSSWPQSPHAEPLGSPSLNGRSSKAGRGVFASVLPPAVLGYEGSLGHFGNQKESRVPSPILLSVDWWLGSEEMLNLKREDVDGVIKQGSKYIQISRGNPSLLGHIAASHATWDEYLSA